MQKKTVEGLAEALSEGGLTIPDSFVEEGEEEQSYPPDIGDEIDAGLDSPLYLTPDDGHEVVGPRASARDRTLRDIQPRKTWQQELKEAEKSSGYADRMAARAKQEQETINAGYNLKSFSSPGSVPKKDAGRL